MRRWRIGMKWGVIAWTCLAAPLPAAAQAQTETKAEAKIPTREVVDETGRRVKIPVEVRRIVSLAPNLTEIIYALGAEDRLVGVSAFSDKPAAAKDKPRIGMPMNPSLEAIAGMKPDLVLATAINRWETADALRDMGIAVYGVEPHTVEETLESITHIGDVIGAEEEARTAVATLQQKLDALKAKLAGDAPKRVLFVVWEDPLITIGQRTFIADAMRWAGAESVVKTRQDWPQVSLEEIVRLEPDYIVYAESGADSAEGIAAAVREHLQELRERHGWRNLKAIQEGRVAVVSDDVNLPAPGLIDAIEQLARQIHPEAFAKNAPAPATVKNFEKLASERTGAWRYSTGEEIACGR
ncbi:MAG TPA: ABC transporter substrate-binding protein [Candidatus Acidoferrales bacterium]|nr:ABC transporter substrate-binding protein [Candidatus Acidoferrales bacterium]